jgi:hypothetical protein
MEIGGGGGGRTVWGVAAVVDVNAAEAAESARDGGGHGGHGSGVLGGRDDATRAQITTRGVGREYVAASMLIDLLSSTCAWRRLSRDGLKRTAKMVSLRCEHTHPCDAGAG